MNVSRQAKYVPEMRTATDTTVDQALNACFYWIFLDQGAFRFSLKSISRPADQGKAHRRSLLTIHIGASGAEVAPLSIVEYTNHADITDVSIIFELGRERALE